MNTYKTLEFDTILAKLSEFSLSENTKQKLLTLTPYLNERECKKSLQDTSDARKILDTLGNVPISAMLELDKIFELAKKGSMLLPEQLNSVAQFINSCKRVSIFLKKAEDLEVNIAFYGRAFCDMTDLYDEIEKCIRNEKVDNSASPTLNDIRRKIENAQMSVKTKLDTVLKSKKKYLSDYTITTRNGRYVLPVKKEYKNQVSGMVIDSSGTGSTVFIEPSSIRKAQEELSSLEILEDNEVRKILYTLTALVDAYIKELETNIEYMETLDFIFSKAKYAQSIKAIHPNIGTAKTIKIIKGRHPLLESESCVPLDFEIGGDVSGVVITGPNTGGKTVALKTVGLLSLMAQCGLHVPCEDGSVLCMSSSILCDIGDGQSISENLSTFSSHIKNIVAILEEVSHESLVLLDELGSGTDPAEGMGIAVAILDELRKRDCLFVATTHYPQVKDFAKNTYGLINARMAFDRENLKPLYKLEIGEAGESCALHIAQRLGLPQNMLERARGEAYGTTLNTTEELPIKKKKSVIVKDEAQKITLEPTHFNMGDSVTVYPKKEIGIVYKDVDDLGELIVQIKGVKHRINHKRVKLLKPASELYPENYDFSIIFDTVDNRKARHKMSKGHRPDLEIKHEDLS